MMLSENLADVIQSFAPFSSSPFFSFTGVTTSGVGTRINISYLFCLSPLMDNFSSGNEASACALISTVTEIKQTFTQLY